VNKIQLSNFDAVAFDMEGTIADTIPTHHQTRLAAFEQHGFGDISLEEHHKGSRYGSSNHDILGGILHATGKIDNDIPFEDNAIVQDVVASKLLLFRAAASQGFKAIPGAIDLIEKIAPRFPGKMAIVTSCEEEFLLPFVARYELQRFFPPEHLIGLETTAQAGLRGKPAGDPYRLAMKRLGAKKLLVFEDTIPGIAAGKRAGATVIAFAHNEEDYHDFQSVGLEYPPDFVVRTPNEAAGLLNL
jgi:beta-phosphoglucomutase-like phosphatase (HAD superfamily)